MLSIRRSEVPSYLHSSSFYKSLNEDDDEVISVLRNNMKHNPSVNSTADLVSMLSTTRFWGLDTLPAEALHYAMFIIVEEDFRLLEEFEDPTRTIEALRAIRSVSARDKVNFAVVYCRADFLGHLLKEEQGSLTVDTVPVHILARDCVDCLKLVIETGYQPTTQICTAAARKQAFACLRYLHKLKCPWDANACNAAATVGNPEILRYLLEKGCPCDEDAFDAAANCRNQGSVECVKILFEFGCPMDQSAPAEAALHTGHQSPRNAQHAFSVLKFLHEHGCPWDEGTSLNVAVAGSVEVLQWVFERGCPLPADLILWVVRESSHMVEPLDIVQYLHEHGSTWDSRVTRTAAGRGFLSVLKYAHEHGCEWTAEACTQACTFSTHTDASKNLSCLQYLHEQGCPWDVSAACAAARHGKIQFLKYLHQHGCPCDASVTAAAATRDSGCLQYLHESGVPWDEQTCRIAAATGGQTFACLRYAHEQGCPWDHTAYLAAPPGGRIAAYLDLHGCPRTGRK